ncbi:DUF3149 domain-containing protein [Serpentinimonas barnesii]|uniref:DUF3149 domain-containing protein n=1 Tax=Serpentinimonas barnesii TaxID=1458427 RepID=UPI000497F036|nr:DUF3149 domain-containing protein [Serpentinimonas barnesii]
MDAWIELFSTSYGVLSIVTIIGVIVMAAWFYRYFVTKMEESEREEKQRQKQGQAGRPSGQT